MTFCYTAPSKTFLVGEYAVLHPKGGGLILNTPPYFKMLIETSEKPVTPILSNIHKESPCGIFSTQKPLYLKPGSYLKSIRFFDPHEGAGGFGASSAQFAILWYHLYGNNPSAYGALREAYLACHPKKGRYAPSGVDVLAQLVGQVACYQPDVHSDSNEGAMPWHAKHWPFSGMHYSLLKTRTKVNTHEHLADLLTLKTEALIRASNRAMDAFLTRNQADFIASIQAYQVALEKQKLVHPDTIHLLKDIQRYCPHLAVKGCGALGADVVLILYAPEQREDVQAYIKESDAVYEIVYGQTTAPGIRAARVKSTKKQSNRVWVAEKPANLALIKYMGKRETAVNRPWNPSLSYALPRLTSRVEISLNQQTDSDVWQPLDDTLQLNTQERNRFLNHLKRIKIAFDYHAPMVVRSMNHFPACCGLASSASSFAALTASAVLALADLTGDDRFSNKQAMSRLSRFASGSSCRSFFEPWAFWAGEQAEAMDLPYKDLQHHVIMVKTQAKKVSSSVAHQRVQTSPLFTGRGERAIQRLTALMKHLQEEVWKDAFWVIWDEFNDMHALFETAREPFYYLETSSQMILKHLHQGWMDTQDGPWVSVDAGPNIHLLFRQDQAACIARVRRFVKTCPSSVQWF